MASKKPGLKKVSMSDTAITPMKDTPPGLDKPKSRYKSTIRRIQSHPQISSHHQHHPHPETLSDRVKRLTRILGKTPTSRNAACISDIHSYHSEPNTGRHVVEPEFQQLLETGPYMPFFAKAYTMEDAILSSYTYPELVTENLVSRDHERAYEISENARREWTAVAEQETQRFSFYDALFKGGYIVDSLEVPSRMDDISHLIEADVAGDKPQAYCRMVFKSKTVFTGNVHKGHFAGPGRYIWLDGTIYQGDFLDGLMHGEGLLLLPDGCFFEGQFNNGERTGWGIYTTPTGLMYAGDWLKGFPHGQGKVWYNPEVNDLDYYDGQWNQGIIHGHGIRQYPNGDRYIGNFQNGIRLGQGTMVWLTERQVYKGEWMNGKPNGFGEHSWYLARSPTCPYPERNVYKGDFVNGQRHGIGRMVYACGSIHDGRWNHGVKHGKGIYVNPAGELLFAIFRQGTIAGGAEVPLHVPTYACKFRPLVTVLQQRLHTTDPAVAEMEEEYLSETVIRFLCRIRSLYKRAGYLGQWYGNQGHYPQWMKKQDPNRHHLQHRHANEGIHHSQQYDTNDDMMEEPWIHGQKPHYGSPDHINPVTRFGIWLLLKDSPGVLADITLAELDDIWNTVPSISFQTRHHPFEPVQLWQFLQCLVVVSAMLYIEIPKQNYQYEANIEEDEDHYPTEDENQKSTPRLTKKVAVQIQKEEKGKGKKKAEENISPGFLAVPETGPSKNQRKSSNRSGGSKSKEEIRRKSSATSSGSDKAETSSGGRKGSAAKESGDRKGSATKESGGRKGSATKESGGRKGSATKESGGKKGSAAKESGGRKGSATNESGGKKGSEVKEKKGSVVSDEKLKKVEEATVETQTEGRYIQKIAGEAQTEPEEGEQTIRDFLLSEAFELFLTDFLIPSLERRPGKYLPNPPNPLPSLADLYAAFNVVSPDKDVISARDFLLTTLQHRQIPEEGNCLYWTRSRNVMTPDIEMEKLFTYFKQRPTLKDDDIDLLDYDFLSEKLSNSEILTEEIKNEVLGTEGKEQRVPRGSILIFGSGNIIFGEEEVQVPQPPPHQDGESGAGDVERVESETDLDNVPLGEEDLSPVPFLWATDPVCTLTMSNEKIFENVGLSDVLQILRQFYPKTCDNKNVINLEFNLTFGDWLWLTLLVTKLSTDRAFCAWMKNESPVEHKRGRCRQMSKPDFLEDLKSDKK